MAAGSVGNKWRSALRIPLLVLGNIALLGVVLGLVEGFSSLALFASSFASKPMLLARAHAQYDPELGWVSKPGQDIPDMYGPGITLRTNSLGFRNDRDFDPAVPPGQLRLVCSGDSVTLGHGVRNGDTWCAQLDHFDPRIQTVNVGQGGYGIDQAYLWYRRDSVHIDVDIHVLAFITDDYRRMQYDRYAGFGKPLMALERGELVVRNEPVPRRAYYVPWLTSLRTRLSELRFMEFVHLLRGRGEDAPATAELERRTREVAAALFADLQQFNTERRRHTVLVYLPAVYELDQDSSDDWMRFTERQARELGLPLINFFDDFRALSRGEVARFYLDDFHLTRAGHGFVAEKLRERLLHDPAVRQLLAARRIGDVEGSNVPSVAAAKR